MKTITHEQHLQLRGLVLLAHSYERKTTEVQLAIAQLLGVEKESDPFVDVIGDEIWSGDPSVESILHKLSIRPKDA